MEITFGRQPGVESGREDVKRTMLNDNNNNNNHENYIISFLINRQPTHTHKTFQNIITSG